MYSVNRYNGNMDIQRRIRHILRLKGGGLLLRTQLSNLGSPTQISAALKAMRGRGILKRVAPGTYATPSFISAQGTKVLQPRSGKNKLAGEKPRGKSRATTMERYVKRLANRNGVVFSPTYADRWANAVTRLAGDDIESDSTDDLLVALTRENKLSPGDMAKLVMAHHRNAKRV